MREEKKGTIDVPVYCVAAHGRRVITIVINSLNPLEDLECEYCEHALDLALINIKWSDGGAA